MESLRPQLLEIAQLLASGMSYTEVSQAVNVPRSTVGRWAKLPSVQAQVELLRSEAMQAHIEISREAATQSAENLQSKLLQSTKRQEEMIGQGYSLAHECFALTQQMLAKATEIFTSNRAIESHEKILISSLPAYMRAASDMVKAVSDTEDKLFALEEISKRLDQWQQLQMQNDQN